MNTHSRLIKENKKMIVDSVPFIEDKGEKYESCQGPPTTMMALKFFLPNLDIDFNELYEKMRYKHGNWFFETYIVSDYLN